MDDAVGGIGLDEAAKMLGLKPRRLAELCRLGLGPDRYHRRPSRFTPRALEEWQTQREAAIRRETQEQAERRSAKLVERRERERQRKAAKRAARGEAG